MLRQLQDFDEIFQDNIDAVFSCFLYDDTVDEQLENKVSKSEIYLNRNANAHMVDSVK